MQHLNAVLTGDLVASTQASPAANVAAMAALAGSAQQIAAWQGGVSLRFTRFRGDGWQIVLQDAGLALRAMLFLQAQLRGAAEPLSSRISVGVGAVTSLGTRDLADASGPAFIASGRGLDQMGRTGRVALAGTAMDPALEAILLLADEIASRWSQPQAGAMALALGPEGATLEVIGQHFGISKQAANARLAGAGLRAIKLAVQRWEEMFGLGVTA